MKANKGAPICALLILVAAILWSHDPLTRAMAAPTSIQDPLSLAAGEGVPASSVADRLPGQILVRYKAAGAHSIDTGGAAGSLLHPAVPLSLLHPALPAELRAAFMAGFAGQAQIVGQIPQLGVLLLQVPAGSEKSMLEELQRQPAVQYVEPNYRAYAMEVPDDEQWPQQWALAKINAPQAWDIAHCQDVVIAIVDTGAYLEHPDLSNTLWTNPDEIPANGRDDDANGKIDDIHGWHFYQNCTTGTCLPYENPIIDDENGHGTHVTGIAAAETNNGTGVASVSWGARAMIIKVLDAYGDGYYYDIAAGIVYAADNGAQVINLSLGGETPSQLLQDAVNYAYGKGALVVAAAGNNGSAVFYPAACDNAIGVAATDANDQRLSFSNQGPEVDIAAPGEQILSTWLSSYFYYYKRGTSMATPHVSAAAALLWSWRPDWSNQQIQERLQTQADDVNSDLYPGHDPYLGWGRLNLYRALANLPPGPTLTPTGSPQATATVSPQATATPSRTSTITPQVTATPTASVTSTVSPQATATVSPQATASPTPSTSPTVSPTPTVSPQATPTDTIPPPVYRIYVPLGWSVSGSTSPLP